MRKKFKKLPRTIESLIIFCRLMRERTSERYTNAHTQSTMLTLDVFNVPFNLCDTRNQLTLFLSTGFRCARHSFHLRFCCCSVSIALLLFFVVVSIFFLLHSLFLSSILCTFPLDSSANKMLYTHFTKFVELFGFDDRLQSLNQPIIIY